MEFLVLFINEIASLKSFTIITFSKYMLVVFPNFITNCDTKFKLEKKM